MTAVAKLPEKWREDDDCSALEYAERLRCADELEAALSPAELGGTELPVGEVSDGFSGHQRAVNLYGPIRCQPSPGTKLYTTPRAAEAVSEEVERVMQHIGNALTYIEKTYPGTKYLDADPILRNMRRWHNKLRSALKGETK